jgi:hypothetical protein
MSDSLFVDPTAEVAKVNNPVIVPRFRIGVVVFYNFTLEICWAISGPGGSEDHWPESSVNVPLVALTLAT